MRYKFITVWHCPKDQVNEIKRYCKPFNAIAFKLIAFFFLAISFLATEQMLPGCKDTIQFALTNAPLSLNIKLLDKANESLFQFPFSHI